MVEAQNAGVDTVRASVSHTMSNNVEDLLLIGTGAINGTGNDLANSIRGNNANNILTGGAGADTLKGLGGNDRLVGGPGNDVLTGDSGADSALFNAALNENSNVDEVTDFDPAQDTIRLEGSIFMAFATSGPLGAGAFRAAAAASDSSRESWRAPASLTIRALSTC